MPRAPLSLLLAAALLAAAAAACTEAGDPFLRTEQPSDLDAVDPDALDPAVESILRTANCFTCHTYLRTLPAADDGDVIVPCDPEASLLYRAVICQPSCTADDAHCVPCGRGRVPADRMPLGGALAPEELTTLHDWIASGAQQTTCP